jgi:endoglucanase
MSLFWSQWKPQFYNADTVRWIASDWHATVVRAAIAAAGPGSYQTDPEAQLRRAETVIDAAVAAGIYVGTRMIPSLTRRSASSRRSRGATAVCPI